MTQTDLQLLRAYAESRSEAAFAELVRRHVDFVYSSALRMVCDPHLAEDVTQGVFVALAKNAPHLTDRPVLSGWLHRTAQNIAAQTVRTIERRRAREKEAAVMNELLSTEPDAVWEHIRPHLDDALGELNESDRDALLLRYFERKSAREMAQTLGTSEDAAQKRVTRAVERLREFFTKRGVTVGAGGLVIVISANAVQAAPVGLAVTISTAAVLTGTTIAAAATATTIKTIAMTTLQKTLITATLVAVVGVGIYESRQASQFRKQVKLLERQQAPAAEQIPRSERDELTRQLASLRDENDRLNRNTAELFKLRGEVARLRNESRESAKLSGSGTNDPLQSAARDWLAKVDRLKQRLERIPDKTIPEFEFLTPTDWLHLSLRENSTNDGPARSISYEVRKAAKDRFAPMLAKALVNFTESHDNQLPTDLSQLKPYFQPPISDAVLERYDLLHSGNLRDVPSGDPLVTEKAPVEERWDTLYRIGLNSYKVKFIIGDDNKIGSGAEATVQIPDSSNWSLE